MGEEIEMKQELGASPEISLWRAGIVVVFAAVLSNIIAHYVLSLFLSYPPGFTPLSVSSIAILTAAAALGGTLAYALFNQRSNQPERRFKRLGWIVLVSSLIPLLIGYLQPDLIPIPGSAPGGFLMLIPFHLIAGVVIIGLLVRLPAP
jgi:hypothetical protein